MAGLKKTGLQNYNEFFKLNGLELYASDGVPTENGAAKGALAIDTTNGALYINTGTVASATWNNVAAVAASEISLATGSVLIGAAGVGTALDGKTSGQILIGNGTTMVSVALSGDATITSAGVVTVSNAFSNFNVGGNVTFGKELAHTISVSATTTANTIGGALSIAAGAGQGTGAGAVMAVTGGASGAGATGNGGNATVTGGAAASTNGNGGSVVLTAGAKTGSGLGGVVYTRSPLTRKISVTAMTTSATITTAAILGGQITANQGAAGAATYTMPTGSVLAAALPSDFGVGDCLEFSITNISTNAAEDVTVAGDTGMTAKGNMTIASNAAVTDIAQGTFRIINTGSNTFDFYRI